MWSRFVRLSIAFREVQSVEMRYPVFRRFASKHTDGASNDWLYPLELGCGASWAVGNAAEDQGPADIRDSPASQAVNLLRALCLESQWGRSTAAKSLSLVSELPGKNGGENGNG